MTAAEFIGMNVAEVERTIGTLNGAAEDLGAVGRRMDALLPRLDWLGRSAEMFRADWGRQRRTLDGARGNIEGLGRSLRANLDAQRATSEAEGGGGGHGSRSPVNFDNRTSFGLSTSTGLGWRIGHIGEFWSSHGSEGSEVRYTSKGVISFDAGDALDVLNFAAAVRGREGGPIDLDFEQSGFVGTEFIWRQESGSTSNDLKGTSGISEHITAASNYFGGGYSTEDVMKDIRKGEYAPPSAVVDITGVSTHGSVEIEAGSSVFGASGEVSTSRAVEHWRNGSTVDRYTMSGESSSSAGVHLDGGLLGANITASGHRQVAASVATTYDSDGVPRTVTYTIAGRVEAGGDVSLGVGGGGASHSSSQGLMLERELTFDLSDPRVAEAVRNGGTAGLVAHASLATESVSLYSTASDDDSVNALVFHASAESSSATLVKSASRGPLSQ